MEQFLDKLRNKINLNFNESKEAFKILMNGEANDQQIYDFLTLLSEKGEVSDEIAGGVFILRLGSPMNPSPFVPDLSFL